MVTRSDLAGIQLQIDDLKQSRHTSNGRGLAVAVVGSIMSLLIAVVVLANLVTG
jgi:hypothetical protein